MIINGRTLLEMAPITDMASDKYRDHGVSYGLGEAGYDIRLKQEIIFEPNHKYPNFSYPDMVKINGAIQAGRFALGSAIEHFQMPPTLTGIVHDKSTWARRGLSVFNTVVEPGWKGYLTLELVYHGQEELIIPAGAGIAQVIFHRVVCPVEYNGKYQNQENKPVPAVFEHQGPVSIIDAQGVHPSNLDRAVAAAHGVSQKDAKTYVDTIVENIAGALKRGDEVSLHGFGKFKVKDQPAREGRNPATGETIQIAASKKASFSPAKALKDSLNG